MEKTPVLLLTGYLGSGKTTLVNKILSNRKGIRFAVIVNDIGEVNIDADLIQKGGVVGRKDDSLVALQNGCICCTLKMDLVEQLRDITSQGRFDYIVIEASGICEPEPIAQTICSIPSLGEEYVTDGIPYLDCIVTVVDALRLQSEFACGDDLVRSDIDDEDLASLVIQQIEFCNLILLNKASEVSGAELGRIRQIIHTLQPKASIIECDYAEVDFGRILNTDLFDFESVATSAAWIREIEGLDEPQNHMEEHHDDFDDSYGYDDDNDDNVVGHDEDHHGEHHDYHDHDDDHNEGHHDYDEHDDHHEGADDDHHHHQGDGHHGHHHHHHHDHEGGEVEEYGIGTYVYYARKPMDINRFDWFVSKHWPKNVIRAKGLCYFDSERDACYLFEQAGKQIQLKNAGLWYASMPKDQLLDAMLQNPVISKDWDAEYGDRMQKIVFIGQHLDKDGIKKNLDLCLVD